MWSLSLLIGLCASSAHAEEVSHESIQARLAEIEPLRSLRLAEVTPEVAAEGWLKVAAGEVVTGLDDVPGHSPRLGWGVAVLDVEIGALWRAINEDLWHGDALDMDLVEIVAGTACASDRRVLRVMPVPVLTDRWWVVQYTVNHRLRDASGGRMRELRWSGVTDAEIPGMSDTARALVEGKVRVVDNVGGWFLVDLDGKHTLTEYTALSDPGGNVPAGLASSLANGRLAENMRAMESYAQTSERRCPAD